LEEVIKLPLKYLYLGHYGITDQPHRVMARTIIKLRMMMDMGEESIRKGHPELIAEKYLETNMPEMENLRSKRGEVIYQYAKKHITQQGKLFAKYCQEAYGAER
jgi:hypothetical protein